MAVRNPAYVLGSGASNPADSFRRALGALISSPGVSGINDLLVSAPGGMSVSVAGGSCFVAGTSAADQGAYECYSDGSVNLAIAASDPTFARNDLVIAQVIDEAYVGGGTNAWQLSVVTGTPSGSPVDPSVPVSSLVLARVVVPALAASIVTGDLTDLRTRAILIPPASASVAGAPTYGTFHQFDRWTDSAYREWVCTAPGSPGTWQSLGGLDGASAVATGPPTSGSWNKFDRWIDSSFVEWVCTVAGTPGTWQTLTGTFFDLVLSGSLASVTITVPQGARVLTIDAYTRNDQSTWEPLQAQCNGDTGNNYSSQYTQSEGTSINATPNIATSVAYVGFTSGSPANAFSATHLIWPDYGNTVGYKSFTTSSIMVITSFASGNVYNMSGGGFWQGTSAITSILLKPATGSFVAGSRFTARTN